MKTWIKVLIVAVLCGAVSTLAVWCHNQRKQIRQLTHRIDEQSEVIDSLLARRMKVFDVRLEVMDKSRTNVYGRYNKGTISVPSVKTYRLELDSVFNNIK